MGMNAVAAPSTSEIVENAAYSAKVDGDAIAFFKKALLGGPWNENEVFIIFSSTVNSFNLSNKEYKEIIDLLRIYCYSSFSEEVRDRVLTKCLNYKVKVFDFDRANTGAVLTPKGDPRPFPTPVTPDPISPQN